MVSSENTTRCAPRLAASARASLIKAALPATLPTVGLSRATAIFSLSVMDPATLSRLLRGDDTGFLAELDAFVLQRFGDQERQFQRLRTVQARVAMRVVTVTKAGFRHSLGAADAFGD